MCVKTRDGVKSLKNISSFLLLPNVCLVNLVVPIIEEHCTAPRTALEENEEDGEDGSEQQDRIQDALRCKIVGVDHAAHPAAHRHEQFIRHTTLLSPDFAVADLLQRG